MDEQQLPQEGHAQASERAPAYDEHEVGYEAAMPMLQGAFAAPGASRYADL